MYRNNKKEISLQLNEKGYYIYYIFRFLNIDGFEKYCDITFQVDNKIFRAIRMFLEMNSSYFSELLNNYPHNISPLHPIRITGISADLFSLIINYLSYGNVLNIIYLD